MKKPLSTLSLCLLTIGSVDSIRNLPTAALTGAGIFYYFSLALIFFLLPCTIVCIWLSQYSDEGIYGWIKKGLGKQLGFFAVCCQWIQNILVYPTFFSFIAGALLYSIKPELATNKALIFLITNIILWGLTWLNLKGISLSNQFNTVCTSIGLLLPFILILGIGAHFILTSTTPLTLASTHNSSWSSLTAIILSFSGIELAAVHIKGSKNRAFPLALMAAMVLIFFSMLFGALTLALILPVNQLNFISDIPKLFELFFRQLGYPQMAVFINLLIVIGCLGCANNWLLAPIKGLMFALAERKHTLNKLLLQQAMLVTLISSLFLLFPVINVSYWFMLTLATQAYLMMYLLMFIAALIMVRNAKQHTKMLIQSASVFGIIGIGIVFAVSFLPPPIASFGHYWQYELKLILGLVSIIIAALSSTNLLQTLLSHLLAKMQLQRLWGR